MKRKPYKLMQKSPHDFANIQTFCLFIGFARSGHTLIGELLNAHPEVTVGRETSVIKLMSENRKPSRERIFALIMRHSQRVGSTHMGYAYHVPVQYGKSENIKVIGYKKGQTTSSFLSRKVCDEFYIDSDALNKIRYLPSRNPKAKPYRLRAFFWVRNPFDIVATAAWKGWTRERGELSRTPWTGSEFPVDVGKEVLEGSIRAHFRLCAQNNAVLKAFGKEEIFRCKHEDFITHPREILVECADFLGVEALPEWLDACVSIVNPVPHKSRHKIDWTDEQRRRVEENMKKYDFLRGYSWDD